MPYCAPGDPAAGAAAMSTTEATRIAAPRCLRTHPRYSGSLKDSRGPGKRLARLELEHVLPFTEFDSAHDVRPPVELDFVAYLRQCVESHSPGRDELALFVRAIDARHRRDISRLLFSSRGWAHEPAGVDLDAALTAEAAALLKARRTRPPAA